MEMVSMLNERFSREISSNDGSKSVSNRASTDVVNVPSAAYSSGQFAH